MRRVSFEERHEELAAADKSLLKEQSRRLQLMAHKAPEVWFEIENLIIHCFEQGDLSNIPADARLAIISLAHFGHAFITDQINDQVIARSQGAADGSAK